RSDDRLDASFRTGDRRSGHRAQISEADGVRATHSVRESRAGAQGGQAGVAHLDGEARFGGLRPHHFDSRYDQVDRRSETPGGTLIAWPKAMAGDRHATDAGAATLVARRAGRRNDG